MQDITIFVSVEKQAVFEATSISLHGRGSVMSQLERYIRCLLRQVQVGSGHGYISSKFTLPVIDLLFFRYICCLNSPSFSRIACHLGQS